jgi:SCY1-like protein 1
LPNEDFDDAAAAWADMGDMDDDGAVSSQNLSMKPASQIAASAAPFDDGEPDFAAWLAERSGKKPGAKPLPKGLSKSSNSTKKIPASTRPASKPTVGKKLDLKPKQTEEDDGWGDGW